MPPVIDLTLSPSRSPTRELASDNAVIGPAGPLQLPQTAAVVDLTSEDDDEDVVMPPAPSSTAPSASNARRLWDTTTGEYSCHLSLSRQLTV